MSEKLDIDGKQRIKPVPPVLHCLMADVDRALGQKILDTAKAQRKARIHYHDDPDHLTR